MSDVHSVEPDLSNSVHADMDLEIGDQYREIVSSLADDILTTGTRRPQQDTKSKIERAIRILFGNLVRAYNKDPGCFVALPLQAGFYSEGVYFPNPVGYRVMKQAVTYLAQQNGLIEYYEGNYLIGAGNRYRSRIRALPSLWSRLAGADRELHPSEATSDAIPSVYSLVRTSSFQCIVRKDQNKKRESYEDTPEIIGMRERLAEWNRFLLTHFVDIFVSDRQLHTVFDGLTEEETKELQEQAGDYDSGPGEQRSLDLTPRPLWRIFNNSSWENGGRFYGGWWQRVPSKHNKEWRRHITINNRLTGELDYSNMLPAMLYAMEGLQLEGDAYAIPYVDAENPAFRRLLKKVFLQLINVRPRGHIRPPQEGQLPPGFDWRTLQRAIKQRHAPIARYFRSEIGIRLQRKDSDIAEDVMMGMMRRNILVLPIHDSFIVDWQHADELKAEMETVFQRHSGRSIQVDVSDSFVHALYRRERASAGTPTQEVILDLWSQLQNSHGHDGYFKRLREASAQRAI